MDAETLHDLFTGDLPLRTGDFVADKDLHNVCGFIVGPAKVHDCEGYQVRLARGNLTWIRREDIVLIAPREWE